MVAVDDVEGVLPPVVVDVVAFESLERKDLLAGFPMWHHICAARICLRLQVDTHDW